MGRRKWKYDSGLRSIMAEYLLMAQRSCCDTSDINAVMRDPLVLNFEDRIIAADMGWGKRRIRAYEILSEKYEGVSLDTGG